MPSPKKSWLLSLLVLLVCNFVISAPRLLADDAKEVTITANDQMKYDVTAFEVKAGQKVTLTFKNIGTLPKTAMGHNFVLLKQGTDVTTFANAAMAHAAEGYIPPDMVGMAGVIAFTKLLGPGESDTITFNAPVEGVYDYICTFPGHVILGMRGKMTVK